MLSKQRRTLYEEVTLGKLILISDSQSSHFNESSTVAQTQQLGNKEINYDIMG